MPLYPTMPPIDDTRLPAILTPSPPRRTLISRLLPYAIAATAVLLTTLLRLVVGERLADPALFFLATVSLVAWRGGARPGCFAVALSAYAQARYLIAPDHFLLATVGQAVELTIWSAEGVLVCALFGALRSARMRAVDTAQALARNQSLLTESEERLRHANDGLESEVDARTAELARANRDLLRETSEREQMTEQLRQAQKMEAVGRLAGGVAHDFNNVLSVILTLAAVHLDESEPEASSVSEILGDLVEIRKAAQRAAELTRQLLMFSRRRVVQETRAVNVRDVIDDMDQMLRRLVGEDVAFVTSSARPAGSVGLDSGSVGQVVMNLVVNARDAMPKGGRLTLELADVVLDEAYARHHIDAKPGPHVMVSVTDTGHGMDGATMARIFEPFFTTKEKGKGTGLGLSTVFGVVHAAGGTISVSSETGVGTTFRIYFPRVDAPRAESAPRIHVGDLRGAETVLLVEDEEQVRAAARGVLCRQGYRVLEAKDGFEALRVSEGHAGIIHVLLTDVVMPGMGGQELAARLAVARPDTKVLCMSGYTDESVVGPEGLGAGVSFMEKPFEPGLLAKRLRDVLDGDGKAVRSSRFVERPVGARAVELCA